MKSFMTFAAAVACGLLVLSSPAMAKGHPQNHSVKHTSHSQSKCKNNNCNHDGKGHGDCHKPPKGTTPPVKNPPFGHGPVIIDPVHPGKPWQPVKPVYPITQLPVSQGTIVRDHRHPTFPGLLPVSQGTIVRDHRGDKGSSGLTGTLKGLEGTAGSLVNTVGRDAGKVLGGAEKAAGSVVSTVGRDAGKVLGGAEKAAGTVVNTVGGAIGTVGRDAGKVLGGAEKAAGSVVNTVGGAIGSVGNDIGSAASSVADAIGDLF